MLELNGFVLELSGNKNIRLEVVKGKFEQVKVEEVVKQIEDADINIMGNYIYGLPGDDKETINETYKLSTKLNTLGWNTYVAMVLPEALFTLRLLKKGIRVPKNTKNMLGFHMKPFHYQQKNCSLMKFYLLEMNIS